MHTNPETLALLALGEDIATADEQQHVPACAECRQELSELQRLTDLGRAAGPDLGLSEPAPHVWEEIRAELGFTSEGDRDSYPLAASLDADREGANVLPITPARDRRSRSLRLMAVAAALALVAGIGIGLGIDRLRQPSETAIATGTLDAFPSWAGSTGTAEIETDSDGLRTLVVTLTTSRPGDNLTVWLMDPANGKLQTMGSIVDGHGRYVIGPGVSLEDFPAVDVSDEPWNDGNPAHSGNTVVRGEVKP